MRPRSLPSGWSVSKQRLRRDASDREDERGREQLDLPVEIGTAASRFLGPRVAVSRRPALEHVGDVHLLAPRAERTQHRIEQLARAADEGLSASILFRARRLPDDHPAGVRPTHAEHRLRPAGVQAATCAGRHLRAERLPVECTRRAGLGAAAVRDRSPADGALAATHRVARAPPPAREGRTARPRAPPMPPVCASRASLSSSSIRRPAAAARRERVRRRHSQVARAGQPVEPEQTEQHFRRARSDDDECRAESAAAPRTERDDSSRNPCR